MLLEDDLDCRNDHELVRATLSGDHSAYGELVSRYRDAAFGIAFHKLGNFEAARDAAQEALVTAYVELAKLREPSKFGNWLYRITSMSALAYLRRKRVTVSLDDVQISQSEPNPAESAERSEKAKQVRDALASLPEPEQLAVILHYVDGYSHEEIGGMLGASTSAVKSRVHRAKGKLREELREMVESNLKSETPKIEFTEDIVRLSLRRDRDQGVAVLNYNIPAALEFTDETRQAIFRVASELAEEGYSWLVAPPPIRADSPAYRLLKNLGFQVECEFHCYERPLRGKLPKPPPIEADYEVKPFRDTDPLRILDLFQRTTMKDGVLMKEEWIRRMMESPDLFSDASIVACHEGKVVAVLTTFKITHEYPDYGVGTAVFGWTIYDESSQPLEHLIASALRTLKTAGVKSVVGCRLQPHYHRDQEVISILKRIGFAYTYSEYALKLPLDPKEITALAAKPSAPQEEHAVTRRLRALPFSVVETDRDPKYARALQIKVTEVLGTSAVVAPGEVYVVVGEYTLSEPIIPSICLGNSGESWGFISDIDMGTRQFAATANILKVTPGKEDRLVLHTPGVKEDTIRHLVIKLEK